MPIIKDWDRIAGQYSEHIRTKCDLCLRDLGESFWKALGDLKGRSVLELGCGNGVLAGQMLSKGAQVIGLDGSMEFLQEAKKVSEDLKFFQADLNAEPDVEGKFDLIISHMTLMDLRNPSPLVRSIPNFLNPNGRFIFTIPHPVFFHQKREKDVQTGNSFKAVRSYLSQETWRINTFGGHDHFHRSLSWYFSLVNGAGLSVDLFLEPPHQTASRNPLAEFYNEFPLYVLIRCVLKNLALSYE